MMKTPSKEELQFIREVYPWAEKVEFIAGDTFITFKKEVPQEILVLFDELTQGPYFRSCKRAH